jgi:Rad3-related DNA helicase
VNDDFKEYVLEILIKHGHNLFDDYKDFFKLAMACKKEKIEYSVFDRIVFNSKNYNEEENNQIFRNCEPKEITFGTIFYYAELTGKNFKKNLSKHLLLDDIVKDYSSCVDVYSNDIPFVLRENESIILSSPCGSGKTHHAIEYILHCIEKDIPICYILSRKKEIDMVIKRIKESFGKTINELKICRLDADNELKNVYLKGASENKNKTKINGIFTHHHYLLRKGIDLSFFALYKYLTKSTVVIIDEADNFFKLCDKIIALSQRYKLTHRTDGNYYIKRDQCMIKDRSGSCKQCFKGYNSLYESDNFNTMNFKYKIKVHEKEFLKDLECSSEDTLINEKNYGEFTKELIHIPEKNVDVHKIEIPQECINAYSQEHGMHSPEMIFSNDKTPILSKTLYDIIKFSYNPMVYRFYPTVKDKEIHPDDITKDMEVKYPYELCNRLNLILKDKKPILELYKKVKKTIFLSATITAPNVEFVKNCMEKTKHVKVDFKNIRIKKLTVIAIKEKPTTNNILEILALCKSDKTKQAIFFKPTKKKADNFYKNLRRNDNFKSDVYKYAEDSFERVAYDTNERKENILITYSRGNLGRAHDLPDFDINLVDCDPFLPIKAVADTKKEKFVKHLEVDRLNTIIQNSGRILRADPKDEKHKIIVLLGLENKGLETLMTLSDWQSIVKEQIQTIFYEHDTSLLKKNIEEFYEKKVVTQHKEISKDELSHKKGKEKGIESLTLKQRKAYHKIEQSKKKTLKERIAELHKEGRTWGYIYRKLHLDRQTRKKQIALKKYFYKLCTETEKKKHKN